MNNDQIPERLPPILANEFCANNWQDVPKDILYRAYGSAERVLNNPDKFPNADFNHLEELANALHARVAIMRLEDALNAQIKAGKAA